MVIALVFVMLVQLYMGIVHIVSGFRPNNMLRSLTMRSSRSSAFSNQFEVGDTIKIIAESNVAKTYSLKIYRNSSSVFEKEGQFNESIAAADIFLNPPTFNAGRYLVVFCTHSYDIPILGVTSCSVCKFGNIGEQGKCAC